MFIRIMEREELQNELTDSQKESQQKLKQVIQTQAKMEAEYLDMVEWYRHKSECNSNIWNYIFVAILTIIVVKTLDKVNEKISNKSNKQTSQDPK